MGSEQANANEAVAQAVAEAIQVMAAVRAERT